MCYENYKAMKREIAENFSPYHATARRAWREVKYKEKFVSSRVEYGKTVLHSLGRVNVVAHVDYNNDSSENDWIGEIVRWPSRYESQETIESELEPYQVLAWFGGQSASRAIFESTQAKDEYNSPIPKGMPKSAWLKGIKATAEKDAYLLENITNYLVSVSVEYAGAEIGNSSYCCVDILEDHSHLDSVAFELAREAIGDAREWLKINCKCN